YMGISSAISNALSGLRFAQTGLDLVAQNVSSANVPGYTKKTLQPVVRVAGGRIVGVDTNAVSRVVDTLLQRQLRTEQSGASFTDLRAQIHSRLDNLFGVPGSENALETVFGNFTNAVQALATSPESLSARDTLLEQAQLLTGRINGISDDIQSLRSEAEQ